jgi:predicted flavoprotein YhiN
LLAFEKISVEQPFTVTLIPEADTTRDMWITRLEETIHSKKNIGDVLKPYFPQRLSQAILTQLHIQSDVFMTKISSDSIKKIAHFLSGGRKLQLTMRRPGDEFVTAGGVCLDEINPETMESKLTP